MTLGGSRWYRVDFHLHTPGVDSFAGLDGVNFDDPADQRRLAVDYAARLKAAGIEIAAITDYNGIREPWFSMIREEAALHGIVVLPGVELSVAEGKNGVHILVVFGPETDPALINEYLRSLDRKPAENLFEGRQHRDLNLRDPLVDVLKGLRDRFDCLLIPAHADDRKGIVSSLGPQPAAAVIAEADLDGLDHGSASMEKIRSTRVPGRWLHLALVEFSDPRNLADIGTRTMPDGRLRATWLKLSSLEIDAMRLALHDPQTRVSTTAPTAPSNGRIVSVSIEGTGFLHNTTYGFDANLNTLIGGRGTGKSAILETIRYCLGIEAFCDELSRHALVKHALGSGGRIELEVERHSDNCPAQRYRISRIFGDTPIVTDHETGDVLTLEPKETFGPDHEPIILLQREIDKVSSDQAYRRLLLDRLIGDDVHQAEKAVEDACAALRQNGLDVLKHATDQASLPELLQDIGKVEHELKLYESNGVMDKLSQHTALLRLRDGLTTAHDLSRDAQDSDADWQQGLGHLTMQLDESHTTLSGHDSAHASAAAGILATVSQAVRSAQEQILAALQPAEAELLGLVGQHDLDAKELAGELNKIKQSLNTERLDADHALSLSRRLAPLQRQKDALDRKVPQFEALKATREGLLDDVVKQRGRASKIRLEAARTINARLSSRVEVVVTAHGDIAQFGDDLKQLLHGCGAQGAAIEAIAQSAVDGASIANAVREGVDDLMERFGISLAQATKVRQWLADETTGRLSELELIAPRDRVDIVLHVEGENRPLDRASAGQRATAILMLIFAVDDRCMILDQPEDDLDNRFIFDEVVQMIREQKATLPGGTRQIIAATHNPNIPVLGDAELVVVLDATGSRIQTLAQGSIDSPDIRKHVRQVLEGGEEAFNRRFQIYGGMRVRAAPQAFNPLASSALLQPATVGTGPSSRPAGVGQGPRVPVCPVVGVCERALTAAGACRECAGPSRPGRPGQISPASRSL